MVVAILVMWALGQRRGDVLILRMPSVEIPTKRIFLSPPLVTWLEGKVIWENPNVNPRSKLTRPRKLRSSVRVVGAGQSWMNWILVGSTCTPLSSIMYPRYWTWVMPKVHFSKLAHNLCCHSVWRTYRMWWCGGGALSKSGWRSEYHPRTPLQMSWWMVARCHPSTSWRLWEHLSTRKAWPTIRKGLPWLWRQSSTHWRVQMAPGDAPTSSQSCWNILHLWVGPEGHQSVGSGTYYRQWSCSAPNS